MENPAEESCGSGKVPKPSLPPTTDHAELGMPPDTQVWLGPRHEPLSCRPP